MLNYNTFSQDIYSTKRSVLNFSSKLSEGMQKPNKNFLMDMLFGLAKGNSVLLSDIARSLDEPIDTIQTIKRLSRSEEHTSELQSRGHLVCRLLLQKKKITIS